jgi:hypothetical protein
MGFFDIDGKRYWDIRQMEKSNIAPQPIRCNALPSDSYYRRDARELEAGNCVVAQTEKERIEDL